MTQRHFLFQYIRIEYKRMAGIFANMAISILMILLLVGVGAFAVSRIMGNLTDYDKVTVAMVLPQSDEAGTLRLLSGLLESQESVASAASFTYMSEEEARSAMHSGQVQAAIILGDTFIHDVMTGINTPATILLPQNSALNSDVFREEVRDGVSLIRTGESAIYSVTEAGLTAYPMVISRTDMENLLTDLYTAKAMKRGDLMQSELISAFGESSILHYYAASGLSMIVLLSGIIYGALYTGQDLSVRKKLRINGIGPCTASLVRVLVMTSTTAIFSIAILLLLLIYEETSGLSILDKSIISHIPGMILISFSLAGFFHLMYSLTGETTRGSMMLLLLSLFMILACGCVFPSAFLPHLLEDAGRIMPMILWRSSVTDIMYDRLSAASICLLAGTGVIFTTGGVLCQIRKIRS